MISNPVNPPAQYVPPKPVPAVRAVPPCTSPLTPRPMGYRVTAAGAARPATLPATGGAGAAMLGLGLAAVALAARRLRSAA